MSFVHIYIHKYEPYIVCIFVDFHKIKKKTGKKKRQGSWKIMESDWRGSNERGAVKKIKKDLLGREKMKKQNK